MMDVFTFFWLIIKNIIDCIFNIRLDDSTYLGWVLTAFIILSILYAIVGVDDDDDD